MLPINSRRDGFNMRVDDVASNIWPGGLPRLPADVAADGVNDLNGEVHALLQVRAPKPRPRGRG
jgi:hypothetical protein